MTVVEHRFDHIPQDARRGRAWVASLAPLVEARLADGATVPPGAFHRYHHLGEAVVAAYEMPAQTVERSESLVAEHGLDHLVLQTYACGRVRITKGAGSTEAGPGDLVVLDLGQPVRIEAEPAVGAALYVPRRALADPWREIPLAHGEVLVADRFPLARLVAGHLGHLTRCLPASPSPARHLVAATLALCRALLAEREGDGSAADAAFAVAVRRFVDENLRTVDVAALSVRFGLSRTPLYQRFAGQGGIATYIRDRRLAAAMRHLSRPPGGRRPKLARVAHECGFVDARVLSRAFHRKYGVWPAEVTPARPFPGLPSPEPAPMAWLREL